MSNENLCAECGAPLPPNLPKGLCSRCALRGALELGNDQFPASRENAAGFSPTPGPEKSGALSRDDTTASLRQFGDYELLEEIARGGMGIVYKARQVSLDRIVAVKLLLLGQYASQEFIHRFRIEASAAASLQHPNIVAIHEVGVHQGQHYFAMDFVDGPNLAQFIGNQPLPAKRVAGYLKTIAEAIQFAHTRGILHRDLKPSNVLIDSNDQTRVTDFGLAKRFGVPPSGGSGPSVPGTPSWNLTVTGQVLGSPNFMPPEQASAQRGQMGPPSDIYSLGAILYHALTGRPPFVGETLSDTLQQLQNTEPVAPRLLVPSVPADLETICLKCLEKEPAKRFQSAQELADELGRFLRDEPIRARPVSPAEKLWRWSRRHPLVTGLAAVLAMVLVAVTVGSTWAAIRFQRLNRQSTLHLRDALMTQAREVRQSGRPGQRFKSIDVLKEALALENTPAFRGRGRDEAIAIMALPDIRFVAATNLPEIEEYHWERALFDSRLELCAMANEKSEVRLLRVGDGQEVGVLRTSSAEPLEGLRFSPDSRFLALRQMDQLIVCDLSTRSNILETRCWKSPRSFNFAGVAFAADSRHVAFGDEEDGIVIHELPGGVRVARWQLTTSPPLGGLRGWALAFSPDDQTLAVASKREAGVVLRDVSTGAVRMQLRHEGILIRSLAWSADGKLLAGGDVDGMVVWWDSTTGERRGRYEGHLGCAHDVAFNHAGSVLASAGLDNTIRFWDLVNERPLFEIQSWVSHICFTADDRRLGLAEEHRRPGWIEWSASEVLWVRRYYTVYDWAPLLVFDSSDKFIACTSEAGLTFRDTRTGRDLGPLVFRRATGLSPGRARNEFMVSNTNGVWRLGLRILANGGLDVAQRELFLTNSAWQDVSLTTGGKLFAALNRRDEQVAVMSMEDGQVQRRVTGRHFDSMAASPDGRFIFTSQWQPMRAEVWDAHTGALLSELSIGQNWRGAFSPDGRWLATFSRDCQLWETGTWRPGPSVHLAGANRFATSQGVPLGGGAAFSPDGRLLAVVQDLREVRLFALPEGRVVATLPASGGARLQTLSFSGDGSMLAAATARGEVHLWNLSTLRTRLAGLGLNW